MRRSGVADRRAVLGMLIFTLLGVWLCAATRPLAVWAADAAPKKVEEKGTAEKGTVEKASEKVADKAAVKKGTEKAADKAAVVGKGGEDEAAAKKKRDAIEKALDEKPGREKAAGEDAPDGAAKVESGPNPKESVLLWLYTSMGKRYVVIFLALTFNEIALVVMIVLALRRKSLCPLELAERFEEKLDAKQYQEAYDIAKGNSSMLGKVLAAGMANLSEGHEAALEAMHEVGEEQNMRIEQRNGHIALIAQLGPMLGLLATVDGIVRAFAVIAGKDVTPKPSELAQGIGVALVNTVVGLWLAIPSIIFYHLIRNRSSRIVLEVSLISTRLMKRFAKVSASVKKT